MQFIKLQATIFTTNRMPDMKRPQYHDKLFALFTFSFVVYRALVYYCLNFTFQYVHCIYCLTYSHYSLLIVTIDDDFNFLSHTFFTNTQMLTHMMRMSLQLPTSSSSFLFPGDFFSLLVFYWSAHSSKQTRSHW